MLDYYKEKGWSFKKKFRDELRQMDPTLEGELTGDLLSIHPPNSDSWFFPIETEHYFGVMTEPSEKMAWISLMKTGIKPP